jgi:hypothetical protein
MKVWDLSAAASMFWEAGFRQALIHINYMNSLFITANSLTWAIGQIGRNSGSGFKNGHCLLGWRDGCGFAEPVFLQH